MIMNELIEQMKTLSEHNYKNVLILDPKDSREVFTEKRMEIIDTIKNEEVNGISELSRKLGRKKSNVFEDLRILFENGVVDFKEEGKRKIPVLSHKNIFVRPLVLEESSQKEGKKLKT